ncbi:MAG: hypothetical protein IPH03_03725 [Tetrasphaera sp.]|nr:hypothetical protein [Tetrasphaera sp.]
MLLYVYVCAGAAAADPARCRYERLAAEAERSRRSVAAVIREAIDLRFPDTDGGASAAAGSLLALTATPDDAPGEGPAELQDAYAAALDAKVDGR